MYKKLAAGALLAGALGLIGAGVWCVGQPHGRAMLTVGGLLWIDMMIGSLRP